MCVRARARACVRNLFTLMAEKESKTGLETIYKILSIIYVKPLSLKFITANLDYVHQFPSLCHAA